MEYSSKIIPGDLEGIKKSAAAILAGGVVAFPTETFYGLAADALNETALENIFRIKERERGNPLLLLIPGPDWVPRLAKSIPPAAEKLMEKFWPGPLTLIFPASEEIPSQVTGGTGTVGLRVSSHPIAQQLVHAVGRPITATSANLSGKPSVTTAREVLQTIGEKVNAILDGGDTPGGPPSTVLDISGSSPRVLREGTISKEELDILLGSP